MRNVGEVAPEATIVNVPVAVTLPKSSGYRCVNVAFHGPRSAPTPSVRTVVAPRRTSNDEPDRSAVDNSQARFTGALLT